MKGKALREKVIRMKTTAKYTLVIVADPERLFIADSVDGVKELFRQFIYSNPSWLDTTETVNKTESVDGVNWVEWGRYEGQVFIDYTCSDSECIGEHETYESYTIRELTLVQH